MMKKISIAILTALVTTAPIAFAEGEADGAKPSVRVVHDALPTTDGISAVPGFPAVAYCGGIAPGSTQCTSGPDFATVLEFGQWGVAYTGRIVSVLNWIDPFTGPEFYSIECDWVGGVFLPCIHIFSAPFPPPVPVVYWQTCNSFDVFTYVPGGIGDFNCFVVTT